MGNSSYSVRQSTWSPTPSSEGVDHQFCKKKFWRPMLQDILKRAILKLYAQIKKIKFA